MVASKNSKRLTRWAYRSYLKRPFNLIKRGATSVFELSGVIYQGPAISSPDQLERFPRPLRSVLQTINGFIAFHGGLHIRGICTTPEWHSLDRALNSSDAFHELYLSVEADDIPFAQDCVGDQYLLRGEAVYHLQAETDELSLKADSLGDFFAFIKADPVETLGMHPLLKHLNDGGQLEPGQLLHAYPPFCSQQASDGVSLRAVPCSELIGLHADFARQIANVPDGSAMQIVTKT